MKAGRILRFDHMRGYGFIAPAAGGDDVFVHANNFGELKHLVHPGMRVEYESEEGDRGPKVTRIQILDRFTVPRPGKYTDSTDSSSKSAPIDDDSECDILTPGEFTTEITEVLLQHVPSLTGSQISQIRHHLVDLARSHGWVES